MPRPASATQPSPYRSSGAGMVRLALHPQVAGVVDLAPEYRMEEIEVTDGCPGSGRRIGDVRSSTVIAALRRPDGEVQLQPGSRTTLRPGDILVATGTDEALSRLEGLFIPRRDGTAA